MFPVFVQYNIILYNIILVCDELKIKKKKKLDLTMDNVRTLVNTKAEKYG